jgi:ribosomal protein S18 acetylase RimI-like enzyme
MKHAATIELLSESESCQDDMPQVASLIYASMPAYFDVLFGSAASARLDLLSWIGRPRSAFAFDLVRVMRQNTQVVGATVELGGDELATRQLNDSSWLLRHSDAAQRRNLASNAALLRAMAPKPLSNAYYLRCLSVDERCRGMGVGRELMSACVSNAVAGGFRSLHLDVRADNVAAINLYRHHGLTPTTQTVVEAARWHTLHMVREFNVGES